MSIYIVGKFTQKIHGLAVKSPSIFNSILPILKIFDLIQFVNNKISFLLISLF